MTIRTTVTTVTFARPFALGGIAEMQPAGDYQVETDEEPLAGAPFPAYRRILTLIHLHEKRGRPGVRETVAIDPNDLQAALRRDRAPIEGTNTLAAAPHPR